MFRCRALALGLLFSSFAFAGLYSASVVHTFNGPEGANPNRMILGPNGTFYGVAAKGGNGFGTLFRVNADNSATLLYAFQGTDGSDPTRLLLTPSGDIYGITAQGGNNACTNGCGTVFKFSQSTGFTSVHQFTGATDGYQPTALILANDNNIYGTAGNGYTGPGNVFRITSGGSFSVLYTFCSQTNCADGDFPSGIMQAQDNNLYGTLQSGAVFKLTLGGSYSIFGSFVYDDGQLPNNLLQTSDGTFYLTFDRDPCCSGRFDSLSQGGVLTVIHQFDYSDGYAPYTLTLGVDGSIYGTAGGGGASGEGLIFQYTSSGFFNDPLYSYLGLYDGTSPTSLVQTASGALYTSVYSAGYSTCVSCGTIDLIAIPNPAAPVISYFNPTSGPAGTSVVVTGNFFSNATSVQLGGASAQFVIDSATQLTAAVPASATNGAILVTNSSGTGESAEPFEPSPFTLSTTYKFCPIGGSGSPCADGNNPSSLLMTPSGAVYGTTFLEVFELNGQGVPVVLQGGLSGANPLLAAADGNLYGTTVAGGYLFAKGPCNVPDSGIPVGCGTIFRINKRGGFDSLYNFHALQDGAYPSSALVQVPNGSIYGATSQYGGSGFGTLFRMFLLTGNPTTIYSFHGQSDGSAPASLIAGQDGNIYGVTLGGSQPTLFRFNPGGSGSLTTLHTFAANEGVNPTSLVRTSDGTIYGALFGPSGGCCSSDYGSIFRLNTDGSLNIIYKFTGGADGGSPSVVFLGADGMLYGVTSHKGIFGGGTVFRLTTGGSLTTMFSFVLSSISTQHGWQPTTLIPAPGGLMGATAEGGSLTCAFGEGCGTLFRVAVP